MSKGKVIGYLFYTIIITGLFLYIQFPEELILKGIERYVNSGPVGVRVKVDKARLGFPDTLCLKDTEISYKETGSIIRGDIYLRPKLREILKGRYGARYRIRFSKGEVEGEISTERANKSEVDLLLNISDFNLSQLKEMIGKLGRELSGSMDGKIHLLFPFKNPIDGRGSGDLVVRDMAFKVFSPFPLSFLGMDRVELDFVEGRFELRNRAIRFRILRLSSSKFKGEFRGDIHLKKMLFRSRLRLTGRLSLNTSFIKELSKSTLIQKGFRRYLNSKGGIPVVIYGTIESPRFRIERI